MKSKILFVFLLVVTSFLPQLKADSPLTSTNFCTAYQHEGVVVYASKTKGILTPEIIQYLMAKKKPIDVKMAVINQLGWNMDGKNNADIFLAYLLEKKKYKDLEDFTENGKDYELLCFAYLKALDNYFEVGEAFYFAQKALYKNQKSYTFNIIYGLINAQREFDNDWCEVYQTTDRVRKDSTLNLDMQDDAKKIIFEYMDMYAEYCP